MAAPTGAAALGSERATRAEIDLGAYEGNVRALRRALSPGTGVVAVVKANAYGHGATAIARSALAAGA
jgi:alanine racemase